MLLHVHVVQTCSSVSPTSCLSSQMPLQIWNLMRITKRITLTLPPLKIWMLTMHPISPSSLRLLYRSWTIITSEKMWAATTQHEPYKSRLKLKSCCVSVELIGHLSAIRWLLPCISVRTKTSLLLLIWWTGGCLGFTPVVTILILFLKNH